MLGNKNCCFGRYLIHFNLSYKNSHQVFATPPNQRKGADMHLQKFVQLLGCISRLRPFIYAADIGDSDLRFSAPPLPHSDMRDLQPFCSGFGSVLSAARYRPEANVSGAFGSPQLRRHTKPSERRNRQSGSGWFLVCD